MLVFLLACCCFFFLSFFYSILFFRSFISDFFFRDDDDDDRGQRLVCSFDSVAISRHSPSCRHFVVIVVFPFFLFTLCSFLDSLYNAAIGQSTLNCCTCRQSNVLMELLFRPSMAFSSSIFAAI